MCDLSWLYDPGPGTSWRLFKSISFNMLNYASKFYDINLLLWPVPIDHAGWDAIFLYYYFMILMINFLLYLL